MKVDEMFKLLIQMGFEPVMELVVRLLVNG